MQILNCVPHYKDELSMDVQFTILTTWLNAHPQYKLLGLDKLARLAKAQGLSRKVVKQWFQAQALNQVFSQPKKRKANHKYKITAPSPHH